MFELGDMDYQPIAFGFYRLVVFIFLGSMLALCFFNVGTVLLEYREQESVDKGPWRISSQAGAESPAGDGEQSVNLTLIRLTMRLDCHP